MSIKKDKYFINLANNLARISSGYTGPNPSVGAIVVKNNEVISFGTTDSSGRPHAEINALKKLSKKDKRNSTMYISLEPCAHYGKTPPCVNNIVRSKLKKVVYSIDDIDSRTSGKSYKILKSKKIKVKKNLLINNSKKIYKNYFYSKKRKIPYIYGKIAVSNDFFLKDKNNFYMTNKKSLETVHMLRSRVNCILTTSKTINADNPKMNCRIEGLSNFSPQIAIIDKKLDIKKKSYLINNAKRNKTFLFYNSIDRKKIKYLKLKKIKLIHTPLLKNNLDINFILKQLYKYEISTLLVESGKSLIYSLINNGYLNEFYLFVSSKKVKKRGIIKMKNLKSIISNKFKYIKFNETFIDKDSLIHYY